MWCMLVSNLYVAGDDLILLIFPKCWFVVVCVLGLYLVYMVLKIKPITPCVLGKHSTNLAHTICFLNVRDDFFYSRLVFLMWC